MSKQKHWHVERDGCLTKCVARMLDVNYCKVPLFVKSGNWWPNLRRYFLRRGISARLYRYNKSMKLGRQKYIIAIGRTHGGGRNRHAVLWKDGNRRYYDPRYTQSFLLGNPEYVIMFFRKRGG